MDKHLVIYDQDCPSCHQAVRRWIHLDQNKTLVFAKFNSSIATEIFKGPNRIYSRAKGAVLVENYRSDARYIWVDAQARLRIYWLLGEYDLGWLCFVPGFLSNRIYSFFSHHRHNTKFGWDHPEFQGDRFLD